MRLRRPNHNWSIGIAATLMVLALRAAGDEVTLLLRNGDRITGTVSNEDTNRVVLKTHWIKELIVPLSQISRREPVPPAAKPPSPPVGAGATAGTPSPPLAPKAAKLIAGELDLGTDLGFSEKNRQPYTGRAKVIVAYEKLHNTVEYEFSY